MSSDICEAYCTQMFELKCHTNLLLHPISGIQCALFKHLELLCQALTPSWLVNKYNNNIQQTTFNAETLLWWGLTMIFCDLWRSSLPSWKWELLRLNPLSSFLILKGWNIDICEWVLYKDLGISIHFILQSRHFLNCTSWILSLKFWLYLVTKEVNMSLACAGLLFPIYTSKMWSKVQFIDFIVYIAWWCSLHIFSSTHTIMYTDYITQYALNYKKLTYDNEMYNTCILWILIFYHQHHSIFIFMVIYSLMFNR